MNGNDYVEDDQKRSYYVSSQNNWAYSCSGIFSSETANSNDSVKNTTYDFSNDVYVTARLCPVSLKYYGFCLRQGSYTVTLHFAEIVYSEPEDHSILSERSGFIFIIVSFHYCKHYYGTLVQDDRVLENFNPKAAAGAAKKVVIRSFNASVKQDHTLRIHLYRAGKGSVFNPPATNGPLISAISVVTP
ncbi:hypothetical protein RJ640_011661, partial [Escallonia rubra]